MDNSSKVSLWILCSHLHGCKVPFFPLPRLFKKNAFISRPSFDVLQTSSSDHPLPTSCKVNFGTGGGGQMNTQVYYSAGRGPGQFFKGIE